MTKPKRPAGIAKNAAANWLAFLFVAAVSFFLSPIIVRSLGNSAYGVWSLLVSVVGYLGLLDFGVRGAVTRYVAHHHAVGDSEGSSLIVSAGMVLFLFLGFVAILLSGVVAYFLPVLFNVPESLVGDSRLVLVVGGLTVAATLVGAVFAGIVTGLERFDVSSGTEIVVTAIRSVTILLALNAGYGLVALGCIHLASSVLYGVAARIAVHRLYPELQLRFRVDLRPHIRTIFSYSMFLSVIHVMGIVVYYSDALVIAAFLPVSAVTFYAIAGNLCEYAYKVAGSLSKMMTPRVSALTSMGSENVSDEIVNTARIATLATAPIAATFWFRGESFINLWMGADYGPAAGEVLRVLAFVVWLGGARSVAAAAIIGVNKHRNLIPAFAFEAVCNLLLSIALVRPFGLVGVAIGTLIPSLIVSLGYIPRCLYKSIGIPAGLFYRNSWLLPSLACLPFVLANVLLEHFLPAKNMAVFFVQIALTLPLVAAGAMVLCLSPAERMGVVSAIRKVVMMAGGGTRIR
ncbi:MAG: oligosaccharide flippase family protein [Pseudomonadota bacterium]